MNDLKIMSMVGVMLFGVGIVRGEELRYVDWRESVGTRPRQVHVK